MGLFGFGKKKKEDSADPQQDGSSDEEEPEPTPEPEPTAASGAGDGKLFAEITKIKAQLDSLAEMRKLTSERFTRTSEQIGELRGMIMDTNRGMQNIEIKTAKAIDLVETVQPDKMMIELQKSDAKVEALKANIESNDSILKTMREQMKEFRRDLSQFRGLEQTIKLSEEVRKELMEIKKTETMIQRHASRVDDIFVEVNKKMSDYEKFEKQAGELDKAFKAISSQFEGFKVRIALLAAKKDVEGLIAKFNTFEKHAGNVLALMDKRFDTLEKRFDEKIEEKLLKADRLLKGFQTLAKKTPDLDKYFHMLEEQAKNADSGKADDNSEPKKIDVGSEKPE